MKFEAPLWRQGWRENAVKLEKHWCPPPKKKKHRTRGQGTQTDIQTSRVNLDRKESVAQESREQEGTKKVWKTQTVPYSPRHVTLGKMETTWRWLTVTSGSVRPEVQELEGKWPQGRHIISLGSQRITDPVKESSTFWPLIPRQEEAEF